MSYSTQVSRKQNNTEMLIICIGSQKELMKKALQQYHKKETWLREVAICRVVVNLFAVVKERLYI